MPIAQNAGFAAKTRRFCMRDILRFHTLSTLKNGQNKNRKAWMLTCQITALWETSFNAFPGGEMQSKCSQIDVWQWKSAILKVCAMLCSVTTLVNVENNSNDKQNSQEIIDSNKQLWEDSKWVKSQMKRVKSQTKLNTIENFKSIWIRWQCTHIPCWANNGNK